jgi:hypothetical protein
VLADNIFDDQIRDLGFECYSCGQASKSRELELGQPVPHGTITMDSGTRTVISETIDISGASIVGMNGILRRSREVGTPTFHRDSTTVWRDVADHDDLLRVIDEIVHVDHHGGVSTMTPATPHWTLRARFQTAPVGRRLGSRSAVPQL